MVKSRCVGYDNNDSRKGGNHFIKQPVGGAPIKNRQTYFQHRFEHTSPSTVGQKRHDETMGRKLRY